MYYCHNNTNKHGSKEGPDAENLEKESGGKGEAGEVFFSFFYLFSFFNLYLTPLRAQQGRGCGCEGGMYKGEEREEKRAEQTNKQKKGKKKNKQMGKQNRDTHSQRDSVTVFVLGVVIIVLSLACGIKQVLKMRLTPFLNRTPTLFSTCRVSENLKSVFPIVWSIENE